MTDLDRDQVDRLLVDGVGRLVEAVVDHWTAVARDRGLSSMDARAVALLDRAEAMTPGALSRALGISPSGTTSVIRRLREAGLLDRDPGPANHRNVTVHLAPGAVESLRLAPAMYVIAVGDRSRLATQERQRIADFTLELVTELRRDTKALRIGWPPRYEPVPAPPRWS